jgi:SAM-dependent methyltransferase
MDNTQRFSNRVENYVKYRPGYPPVLLDFLSEEIGYGPAWKVADIGSGSGISTTLFLEAGNAVCGVEPNGPMRTTAEHLLQGYPRFTSVPGTAERTGLESGSIDLVVAGQAFHWFDPVASRKEFSRILRPEGTVALIWNERQVDSDAEQAYEALLLKYAIDYTTVNHKNISEEAIGAFFHPQPFRLRIVHNEQVFDLDGFKGRVLSSSYMPAEEHERYPGMMQAVTELFRQYQEGGRLRLNYLTKLFVGRLNA